MKEYPLKVEIAQLSLSVSGVETTPRCKTPFFDIRFLTDREPVSDEIYRFAETLRSVERMGARSTGGKNR